VRLLAIGNRADLEQELARVGADPLCWPIFRAKSRAVAVKVDGLSTAGANILKQTVLTCGGDCAVNRAVVSGRVRCSDAVLFVTMRQLRALVERLKQQPECVARLVPGLVELSGRILVPVRRIRLGRRTMDLGRRTRVMGILNVTPDSFSDGGRFLDPAAALDHAVAMAGEGADIIDVGAESTRPGSRSVPAKEQIARLRPVLRSLRGKVKVPVSVDTASARVARVALDEGADIVNDVSALADPDMAAVVARAGAPCILMHMKGRPRTMQQNPAYSDLMAEITLFLGSALQRGAAAGIVRTQMLVDPGLGFGKTLAHNLEILRRLAELGSLGAPVVVGPSRKRFIGTVLDAPPVGRREGTIAACVLAAANGANVLRVHDVKPVVQALKLADAVELRN
jgi:dihydropteroate synthase